MTAAYEVVVVAQDGTPYGTVAEAELSKPSWELNGPGAVEVTLATTDPDAAYMVPGREIQIYYQGGSTPIWWGPIVRPQAGLRKTTWQCAGLPWYFVHRFMGRADRINALTNGDFESGETGWTFNSVTHSTDTAHVVEGSHALKLVATVTEGENWAKQIYTHPSGGYPGGDLLTLEASLWIDNAGYVAPAIELRGLFVAHRNAAGDLLFSDSTTLDDDTARDQWVDPTPQLGILNVQEGDTIDVRLYAPHGTVWWDLAILVYMESLSFGYPSTPVDVTEIIGGIVDYGQDRGGFTHGKSDLNIDHGGDPTGVTRQVAYQFAEHRQLLDAIMEFVRQGLCDISVEFDATTRTFMVWPKSADTRTPPFGKGTLYGTTLELDVNVADFTWSWDLEQAASSVVLLGPGDGPARPEGGAVDTSLLGGAFTVEIVEQAPDNTTIGQLDDRAAERLAVAVRPEILEVTTLPGAGVIGNLVVGDTVPVLISVGTVDINATYRVVKIEADLLKDQATLTLNAIPAPVT